jgi:alpha-galactosidase
MKEHYVLIGAGSAMFTRGLVADLIRAGREARLALVDIDAEALEVAERLARKMIAVRSKTRITVAASTDRRDVLAGATAVICTIGVGGRRAWEQDVFIPRRHGIFAPVGDTVGPGGTSRALRMIPPMVEIARDVLALAPEALFINYGNPMAPVCRAIRQATGANVIGLCHGVHSTARYLAEALGRAPSALQYTATGVNHLTWFTRVSAGEVDMLPRLREIAAERVAAVAHVEGERAELTEIRDLRLAPDFEHSPFSSPFGEPFSWRLLQLFGAFPAPLDRHVTEFFPQFFREGRYYGRRLGLDVFSFETTIGWGDRLFAEMREEAFNPQPLPEGYFERIGGEHEQVVEIVDSIRHGRRQVYSANLPNTGQAPNLPADAILESPAVTQAGGLRAVPQPPLPAAVAGTLATRCQWVETVVEAALEGSREKFVQALILDGAVSSSRQAEALAGDLLAAQAEYLPWARRGD